MLTPTELQHLVQSHADDLARMRRSLAAAGKHASDDDIIRAWVTHSDSLCAGWMALPEDDDLLLTTLQRYLPTHWRIGVLDAESGVLRLSEKLLEHAGWKEGDTVEATVSGDGRLVIRLSGKA